MGTNDQLSRLRKRESQDLGMSVLLREMENTSDRKIKVDLGDEDDNSSLDPLPQRWDGLLSVEPNSLPIDMQPGSIIAGSRPSGRERLESLRQRRSNKEQVNA